MAIRTESITVTPSFTKISFSMTTAKTGNIRWKKPTIPNGATVKSCVVDGTFKLTMNRGTASVYINNILQVSNSSSKTLDFSVDLGTNIDTTSIPVKVKGSNTSSKGTVSMTFIKYVVTYEFDDGLANTHNIKIGATTISNIHLGNTKVDKVYIGDILVFEDSNT